MLEKSLLETCNSSWDTREGLGAARAGPLPWQNDFILSCQEGVIIKSAKFHRWWIFERLRSKIELTLLI